MLNSIEMGIRDFVKEKYQVLFYILFFLSTMFMLVSTTENLVAGIKEQEKENAQKYREMETFVIGKQPDNPQKLLEDLSSIYRENSYTYCHVQLKNEEELYVDTYIIFGDTAQYLETKSERKPVTVLAQGEVSDIDKLKLNGKEYPVEKMGTDILRIQNAEWEETYADNVFVLIDKPDLTRWVSVENSNVIYQLVQNTRILKTDTTRIKQFIDSADGSFLKVGEKFNSENKEIPFILETMYPFLCLLFLVCFLSTGIILSGMVKKRTTEFAIHFIHGAGIRHMIVRFLTFFLLLFLCTLALGRGLGIIRREELMFYIGISCVITASFLLIVFRKLNHTNYSLNLREGRGL